VRDDAGVRDPVAGKTGTTNSGTDVWFVGYTPTLVAGFWFGYDEPRSMGQRRLGRAAGRAGVGGVLPQRLARARRRLGAAGRARAAPHRRHNGHLANEFCPATRDEWFRAGTEPTDHCPEHVYAPEPEPAWENLPPQEGERTGDSSKTVGDKLKRAIGKIFKW
jgi:membrane carboxypeptidase/penicillin-binding protein